MRGVLASPRRRRRLAWLGGMLVLAGVLALVGVKYSNTAPKEAEVTDQPGYVPPEQERSVAFTPAKQHAALAVAAEFIRTAVRRKNLDRAWRISGPSIRQGQTLKSWRTGNIAVVPFPVDFAKWKLTYSYENAVGLEVALFPPPKSRVRATVFDLDVKRFGSGKRARWLVDYFSPSAIRFPGSRSAFGGSTLGVPRIDLPPQGTSGRLSATWLALPFGLLGLIVVVPVVVGVLNWRRNARAYRQYRNARQTSSSSPS